MTTNWVRRVSEILHSSDRINADSAVITLEGNCRFKPLKLKLGRLKRHCNDMGTLMAALVKYVDSDSTKDPESDDEKPGRERRTVVRKDNNTTRRAMGTMVSVKQTIVWILWLTPAYRVMVSVVR